MPTSINRKFSGAPRREFLHVDDLADAPVFLARHYEGEGHLNVGCGTDIAIRELAALIADIVGYRGKITLDRSRPDGTPQKPLDVAHLSDLSRGPCISLRDGIAATCEWFVGNQQSLRQ